MNLKSVCKSLSDYAEYTSRVRRYAKEMEIEEAVEKSITECIQEGILAEFLKSNRAEAKKVSIYEYDQEKHLRMERRDAREEGITEGKKELLKEQIKKKLQKNKTPEIIAEELEEDISVVQEMIAKITQ